MANIFEDINETNANNFKTIINDVSYSDIATKLLKDNLLLTALEFYTELAEAGREIPKLKEFFSNPGNFEQVTARPEISSLRRSSSQVTLDSLDLTRYSEDGERGVDERVAILEFELRKAKETINALRANLTVATESEILSPDAEGYLKQPCSDPIKPHEQRALNFLINEYLLMNGFKLTSITFSDENENQDFEDWDDVGLNIPKPAELLCLYREFMKQSGNVKSSTQNVACQVELYDHVERERHFKEMEAELEQLREQLSLIEHEKDDVQSAWAVDKGVTIHGTSNVGSDQRGLITISTPHSATPECFEMLEESDIKEEEEEEVTEDQDEDDSVVSLAETDADWTKLGEGLSTEFVHSRALEDTNVPLTSEINVKNTDAIDDMSSRLVPSKFQEEVLSCCFVETSKQLEKLQLYKLQEHEDPQTKILHILSQSLPVIIPNIILNKREEIIPLLVCTVQYHSEVTVRDRLLNLLFNLKKRPQEEERIVILSGMVAIARSCGAGLVETEVLPQCWEQLSHRHVERRLLVAESCSALAPYISSSIRNSLMLSMLQQMLLEDKDELVRERVVRSLALIIMYMDDKDKYLQCEELTLLSLEDAASAVATSASDTLLPVLAQWSLQLKRLHTNLLTRLLQRLQGLLKTNNAASPNLSTGKSFEQRIASTVKNLKTLVPYIVMSVANVKLVLDSIVPSTLHANRPDLFKHRHCLSNPSVFFNSEDSASKVLGAFDQFVAQEWYEEWPELEWVFSQMVPDLLDMMKEVEVSNEIIVTAFIQLFQAFCTGFGSSLSRQKVKPYFTEAVQHLEMSLADVGSSLKFPPMGIIPIFLVGVLAPTKDDELPTLLQRFMCALPVCGAPITAIEISVESLCNCGDNWVHEAVLTALWEGVVHPRSNVRCTIAKLFGIAIKNMEETIVVNRLAPALITLASDHDLSVRTAAIPAFGELIKSTSVKEVHDKIYLQLQSILADPATRDTHTSLVQLVIMMGNIVSACEPWFREEVILPQLAATSAYTLQLINENRRIDLATKLLDAFSAAIYCPLSKQTISTALLPGLRYLEPLSKLSSTAHHETVIAMIKSAESRIEIQRPIERSSNLSLASATANVGQGVEDMKNRVSKIFLNKATTSKNANIGNLQAMFRKK